MPRFFDTSGAGVTALSLALTILPVYLLTASYTTLQSNDPRSAALAGWAVASSGSLAFDERWPLAATSWGVEGRDNRVYSNRFPGVIGPAAIAYSIANVTGALDATPVAHPYEVPLWPAAVLAALIAAAAIAVTYLVLLRLDLGGKTALLATAVVALASPVWSISADALWTHGLTHLLLMSTVLAMLNDRSVLAALTAGAAVTVRPHLALAVIILAFTMTGRRERAAIWVGTALGLSLVAAYSIAVFGQPLPAAGYDVDEVVARLPIASPITLVANIADWITSPLRGLIFYVPLVVIGIAVVPIAREMAPRWSKVSALSGLTYAATQLSLIRASGGLFFFGHRTTIEMLVLTLPLLVVGFHHASQSSRLIRRVLALLIVASFTIHAYGAVNRMPAMAEQVLLDRQLEAAP